jgi:hypothetical protein
MPALEIFLIAMRLQTQLDQARATAKPASWEAAVTVCSSNHYMIVSGANDLAIGGIVSKYGIRRTIDFTYCVLDRLAASA